MIKEKIKELPRMSIIRPTGQVERKNWRQTETSSTVDQIAAALASTETEACAQIVGLPIAPLFPPVPEPSFYYALTPIDNRGRLADRSPIRAVGWSPGQPPALSVIRETIVVISRPDGVESITRQGHLRLPARIRHTCRLASGARLLIAATPAAKNFIVVYTMPSLEAILLRHHTNALPVGANK
jgi:hypothetical protein